MFSPRDDPPDPGIHPKRSLVKAVGNCVIMFQLNWKLSVLTVVILPVMLFVAKLYGKFYKKLQELLQDSFAEANVVAEETLSSITTVRSFANENKEIANYADKLKVSYRLAMKESFAYCGYQWCNRIIELSITIIVLYYGGHLVMTNQMSSESLISFILYEINLGECLESMGSVYTGLMQAVGASEKVFEYIDREPLVKYEGTDAPSDLQGKITFESVTFAYPARPTARLIPRSGG
jgi:ATP-binding cassette subfamily B (MDR/TAP) protein 9